MERPSLTITYRSDGSPPKRADVVNNRGSIGIDVACAEETKISLWEHKLIPLNAWIVVSDGRKVIESTDMDLYLKYGLPDLDRYYFTALVPRSSLFKKYGLIVVNSPGIIDASYCGADDQVRLSVFKLPKKTNSGSVPIDEVTVIKKGEYIAQLIPLVGLGLEPYIHPDIELGDSRGGFGSTGGYRQ